MDKTFPHRGIIRGRKLRRIWLVCRVWGPSFSMVGLYKKRRGLGKCETNQILMNRAVRRADSGGFPEAENTKAFVIQNLFRRTEKSRLL